MACPRRLAMSEEGEVAALLDVSDGELSKAIALAWSFCVGMD